MCKNILIIVTIVTIAQLMIGYSKQLLQMELIIFYNIVGTVTNIDILFIIIERNFVFLFFFNEFYRQRQFWCIEILPILILRLRTINR